MTKVSIIVISVLIVIIELLLPLGFASSPSLENSPLLSTHPEEAVINEPRVGFINSTAKNFCTDYGSVSPGQEFLVSGRNYFESTGMYIKTDSVSLLLPVSWDENNSYTMTETYVNISYGNFHIQGKFGTLTNYTFVLCNKVGDPVVFPFLQNRDLSMFIQYVNASFYVSISENSTTCRQYILSPIHSSEGIGSGMNVTLTGFYYNMKIGNPESQCSYNVFTPPSTAVNYRDVNLSRYYLDSYSNMISPVQCEENGTYVLATNNHTLTYYNSVTNNSKTLYSTKGSICYNAISGGICFLVVKKHLILLLLACSGYAHRKIQSLKDSV
jgi:hypothetical protein